MMSPFNYRHDIKALTDPWLLILFKTFIKELYMLNIDGIENWHAYIVIISCKYVLQNLTKGGSFLSQQEKIPVVY